jgi:hypothetical protein
VTKNVARIPSAFKVASTLPTPVSLDPPSKVRAATRRSVGMDSQSVPLSRAGRTVGAWPSDVVAGVLLPVTGVDVGGAVGRLSVELVRERDVGMDVVGRDAIFDGDD